MIRATHQIFMGILLAILTGFNLANAAPAGTVQTDFGGRESITATALQADGKLVAVGFFYGGGSNSFALARYGTDGKLDTGFGIGGKVLTTNFGASSGYAGQAEAKAVALQVDGKIVVAGDAYTNDIALARYNPDGSLDATFGNGGKVVTDWGAASELAFAVGIQSTGKIIVGGYTDTKGTFDFVMTRYNSDGTVDSTFGVNGTVYTDFTVSDDRIEALKVIAGDKIVAVGRSNYNIAVAQYTAGGVLDTQFGTGGKVTTDLGGYYWEMARAVSIDANRKIVVAGQAGPNGDIAVLRYTSSGSLDSKFGSGGKVLTNLGNSNDQGAAVGIDSTGKIVVAGYVGGSSGFEVLRYTSNGALDNTFGSAGRVTTRIGSNAYEQAAALVIQGNGQIIVGGNAGSSITQDNFALARYNSNGSLDTSYGAKADLAASIADSPDPVRLGSTITYTIVVTNNGPDIAEQVVVPVGAGATCTSGCTLGALNSGASTTVIHTASAETATSMTYTASVSSITGDANTANNSAVAVTTVNGAADLALAVSVNPNPGKTGQPLTYTIVVTNRGPDPALKVNLENVYHFQDVNFTSVSTSQGTCGYDYRLLCTLGTINSGASVTTTLVYTPRRDFNFTETITATGVGDPNTANNTVTLVTPISTAADLALTLAKNPDPVKFGNNISYTMTVTNRGPDTVFDAQMLYRVAYETWRYSADFTLVSITSNLGICTLGSYNSGCFFSQLNSGQTATITLVVTPMATGTLAVDADVSGNVTDPNLTNNAAKVVSTVTGAADVGVTLSANPTVVKTGDNITYTMIVTNHGLDQAVRAMAGLTIPLGAQFVSATSSQGGGCYLTSISTSPSTSTSCELGTLNNGASATVIVVMTASTAGNISATAYTWGNIADPNSANDTATINVTASGSADLAITMTDSPDPVKVGTIYGLTYTVTVTNSGPNLAGDVVVTDTLPANVTYGYGNGCVMNANMVTCNLGSISNGASASTSFTVTPTARGTLTNTASVSSGVSDPNMSNNSVSATTTVSR